jgi:hypothetical protein
VCLYWYWIHFQKLRCRTENVLAFTGSVADPNSGSGNRCLFDPWIRDGKKTPDTGSGISNFDHISKSSVTIFGLHSMLGFRIKDPVSFIPLIRDEKNRIRNSVHWYFDNLSFPGIEGWRELSNNYLG